MPGHVYATRAALPVAASGLLCACACTLIAIREPPHERGKLAEVYGPLPFKFLIISGSVLALTGAYTLVLAVLAFTRGLRLFGARTALHGKLLGGAALLVLVAQATTLGILFTNSGFTPYNIAVCGFGALCSIFVALAAVQVARAAKSMAERDSLGKGGSPYITSPYGGARPGSWEKSSHFSTTSLLPHADLPASPSSPTLSVPGSPGLPRSSTSSSLTPGAHNTNRYSWVAPGAHGSRPQVSTPLQQTWSADDDRSVRQRQNYPVAPGTPEASAHEAPSFDFGGAAQSTASLQQQYQQQTRNQQRSKPAARSAAQTQQQQANRNSMAYEQQYDQYAHYKTTQLSAAPQTPTLQQPPQAQANTSYRQPASPSPQRQMSGDRPARANSKPAPYGQRAYVQQPPVDNIATFHHDYVDEYARPSYEQQHSQQTQQPYGSKPNGSDVWMAR
ncbi:hypothetical protein FA09DRAFT_341282 [Tilletiopsis washingtonensis]|jgi:hypothetical protein|uniref:Uncharacterized protein n=1 Tax=Tilletiopsis washingtonensis TaxID=58919 RepID=A0A316Z2Q4_9BASI|nr:hypothetical protein FA09DRAFT_341282 [Tilletiopsis washingtonensis]PWN95364.1 hypothetical protein FA09DRAFT_341282 [Tilletiopsis washingtonensis]